jgi:hypothetical protein
MTARSAGNDNLKVGLLAHASRIVCALFEAAESASSRGGPLAGRLFVHAAALYAGPALRPAESSANACSSLVSSPSV